MLSQHSILHDLFTWKKSWRSNNCGTHCKCWISYIVCNKFLIKLFFSIKCGRFIQNCMSTGTWKQTIGSPSLYGHVMRKCHEMSFMSITISVEPVLQKAKGQLFTLNGNNSYKTTQSNICKKAVALWLSNKLYFLNFLLLLQNIEKTAT